jgi:hypothetical protein
LLVLGDKGLCQLDSLAKKLTVFFYRCKTHSSQRFLRKEMPVGRPHGWWSHEGKQDSTS